MSDRENVVDFNGTTKIDVPISKILAGAAGAKLAEVVVVGWREDGSFYFASSGADAADVNWLLDNAKTELIEAGRV